MFTIAYKTGWIFGYCDRDECRVLFADRSIKWVKSMLAAKQQLGGSRGSP